MEKVAYITNFETPVLFIYPPSRIALQLLLPIVIYFFIVVPTAVIGVASPYQLAMILGIHVGCAGAFLWLVHSKFPTALSFHSATLVTSRFFGSEQAVPYEDIYAVIQTPYLTIFSLKSGQRFMFLPKQTHREKDFDRVLQILQQTLQNPKSLT